MNFSGIKDVHYDKWLAELPSLKGKVVAITGCTSGTGYWAAVCAVRKEALAVILLNRASKRSDECVSKLENEKKTSGSSSIILSIACDLMSLNSVKQAAKDVNEVVKEYGGLDVLANNAGIMLFPDERTEDGYEVQMQVNHLSHFLLTKLLMPSFQLALDNSREVRIVQHSSGARNFTGRNLSLDYLKKSKDNTLGGNSLFQRFVRYHHTKLSNSCFAMKLHKELAAHGFDTTKIKSVAAEPGLAGTDLLAKDTHKSGGLGFRISLALLGLYIRFSPIQSAADGALPLIEACFGEAVDSGDMFYPENIYTGKPYKGISKGQVIPKANGGNEKLTLREENQDILWKASEEAIGGPFFTSTI